MYVIAGLGNPGKQYDNTRHNIGFMTIDRLAEQENIDILEKKHKAVIGKGTIAGQIRYGSGSLRKCFPSRRRRIS